MWKWVGVVVGFYGAGATLIALALPYLDWDLPRLVAMTLFWSGVALFPLGVAIGLLGWKSEKRARQNPTGPPPFHWWVIVGERHRIDDIDAATGAGEAGGYQVFLTGRFQVKNAIRIDAITIELMGRKVEAELTGDWLLTESGDRPFTLTVPKAVAFGTHTVPLIASAIGKRVVSKNEIELDMEDL